MITVLELTKHYGGRTAVDDPTATHLGIIGAGQLSSR